jgi:DNA polymerase-1
MKILFLDAYNLIYRSLSGFKSGENYVIYNFFRNLRPLIEMHNPDKVYFVLEGNPEFRQSLSEGNYKSNRKSKGENFHRQKAAIINIVKTCFPFITVKHPKLECDDTIATFVVKHCRTGDECTIISSDSDFIQLLNFDNFKINLYNPIKKKFIDYPDYDYVVWKALRGDPTDNISGIPGIGDKTATKLVKNSDLLNKLLENIDKRNTFEKNVNLIRLVDFSNDMSSVEEHVGKKDFSKLKEILTDLDFTSMIKEKTWNKYVQTFRRL